MKIHGVMESSTLALAHNELHGPGLRLSIPTMKFLTNEGRVLQIILSRNRWQTSTKDASRQRREETNCNSGYKNSRNKLRNLLSKSAEHLTGIQQKPPKQPNAPNRKK